MDRNKRKRIENYDNRERLTAANRFFLNKKLVFIAAVVIFVVAILFLNLIANVGDLLKGRISWIGAIVSFSSGYLWLYLIGLSVTCFGIGRIYYDMYFAFKNLNVGQKGSNRWTTRKELAEQYRLIPDRKERFEGGGGVPIARQGNHLYIDDSPVNNLIIGITRSGKGELIVFPEIDIYSRAENQASMIIADPKLELAAASIETLKSRGYECRVLNLIDPELSMGFSPLTAIIDSYRIGKFADAELLCSSLCFSIFNPSSSASSGDSQFWADNSTALLSALILASCEDNLAADRLVNHKRKKKIDEENRKRFFEALLKEDKLDDYFLFEEVKKKLKFNPELSDDAIAEILLSEEGVYEDEDNYKQLLSEQIELVKKVQSMTFDVSYEKLEFVPTKENEKKINLFSIINTFATLSSNQINQKKNALDLYFESRPEGNRARLKYATIGAAGDKTKGSIYSNTLSRLQVFTYENIAKMTAASTVDMMSVGFGDKPIAIFIGIPDYDRSNHFIATVFIKQLYFTLAKAATHQANGKCPREVVFMLDEFGNLPAIEDMSNIITVCLGRNIRFNLVIQDFAQIKNLYGDNAATIISNCSNKIYIMTNDNDTAEQYSKDVGTETYTNINRSGKRFSFDKEYVENQDERRLITPDELRNLQEGEMIVTRVIKRKNLRGEHITSYPIASMGVNRMLYRYQYLLDDFPSRTLTEIENLETTDHVDLNEITWSAERYLKINLLLNKPIKQITDKGETLYLANMSDEMIDEMISDCIRVLGLSKSEADKFRVSIDRGASLKSIKDIVDELLTLDEVDKAIALSDILETVYQLNGIGG